MTDSDLEQLLRAINIDPAVLRTHMTQEQADFLIHSAEQAAQLRVEITIDQATKNQWNTMIRAQKKQEVERWAVGRKSEITLQYATDPYQDFYNYDMSYIHPANPFYTTNRAEVLAGLGKWANDPYIKAWMIEHVPEGGVPPMVVAIGMADDLIENTLKPLNEQRKQDAIDLLATQVTSKKAIIDSTDYVALGWSVDDNGNIILPSE